MLLMHALPPPLPQGKLTSVVEASIPMFLVLIGVEMAAAWWLGRLGRYYRANDAFSSLFAGSLQQLVVIFTRGLAVYPWLYVRSRWTVLQLDDASAAHWVGAFLAVELLYYVFHRAAHEINVLWAGHIVHHSSQEYNLTTALRQGVLQSLTSWPFYLPLAPFLTFPMFFFHASLNTMLQFWFHTRTIYHLPYPLEYIINSPSAHRVHHGRNPQYIDKNYGGALIVFDILFGTFALEDEPVVFGVTHDDGTWNPIVPQISHLVETWRVARLERTWLGAARCFLDRGPEYNYFALHPAVTDDNTNNDDGDGGDGGDDAAAAPSAPITRATEVRYDSTAASRAAQGYAYFVATTAVAHTIYIMVVLASCCKNTAGAHAPESLASLYAPWERHVHALACIVSMCVAAAILDRRRCAALWLDFAVRLPLLAWAATHGSLNMGPGATVAVVAVSAVWHFAARGSPDDSIGYDPYLRPAGKRA
jgi:sterol desaturase/sphingolipid hydroxylase (fatty acid hydroxylase superfamily)